jgi:hypothetical protein
VQVQGVAFGHRVILDGSEIRVEGKAVDLVHGKFNGRLVKVEGILRYHGWTLSRFGDSPPYFYIDPVSCKIVERVDSPYLTTSDHKGIQPIQFTYQNNLER